MTELYSLRQSSPKQLAFYLAGKVPISLGDLAETHDYSTDTVERLLREKLGNSVSIDSTGFVGLTQKARQPIGKVVKPKLVSAQEELKRGSELKENGDYQAAVECFESAATTIDMIRSRFEAANYTPKKLNQLHTSAAKLHDETRREAAKDAINYNLIKAGEKGTQGESHSNGETTFKEGDNQDALSALRTAIASALDYNENRLHSDSPALSTGPLEERVSKLSSASQSEQQVDLSKPKGNKTTDRSKTESQTSTEKEKRSRTSESKSEGSQSTDDSAEKMHPQLTESAFENSWETIEKKKRLDGQFLLKVDSISEPKGDKKDDTVNGTDRKGREISVDIWKTHNLQLDWEVGSWYALEQPIGSVWTNKKGVTGKRLSSTSDFTAVKLGDEFSPTSNETVGSQSEESSDSLESAGARQDTDAGSSGGSPSRSKATTTKSPTTSEKETADSSGIFDEIVGEFDEL